MNILLSADSYKYTMHKQYPEGTEYVFSYIESRGGEYDTTMFFGLQGFIKQYLSKPITEYNINEAQDYIDAHIGTNVFNREGWDYILKEHNGYLPIQISAIPEGTVVPTSNILLSIVNTDPNCYWLPTFLETALLRAIWYPTTVATRSYHTKKTIEPFLEKSGDIANLDYMLHSFGSRGVSSTDSAMIGGAAHLLNFKGTDDVIALNYIDRYYGTDLVFTSVPAMEHSTVTSWSNEADSYRNMLLQYKDYPVVSIVSDSYNIFEACHMYGRDLRDLIQERIDNDKTFVIRPDSGDPAEVIIQCLDILKQYFVIELNGKGYKNIKGIRILWGDGITLDNIRHILAILDENEWSTDIVLFGQGGGLLQQLDRDTLKFAMKCSAVCVNGEWRDVFKNPITDSGKVSKKGRLDLVNGENGYITARIEDVRLGHGLLDVVFENGKLVKEDTFDVIRGRVQ
jgi:nicotinamide phosphoribosyltransferase